MLLWRPSRRSPEGQRQCARSPPWGENREAGSLRRAHHLPHFCLSVISAAINAAVAAALKADAAGTEDAADGAAGSALNGAKLAPSAEQYSLAPSAGQYT
jgi:hypothetical protein